MDAYLKFFFRLSLPPPPPSLKFWVHPCPKAKGMIALKAFVKRYYWGLMKNWKRVSKVGFKCNLEENEIVEHNTANEMLGLSYHVLVLNPPCVRSKSLQNDSLKGHFEKRKAKSSKDASSSRKKFIFFYTKYMPYFYF